MHSICRSCAVCSCSLQVLDVMRDAHGALAVSGSAILYLLCRDSANVDLVNVAACRVLVALLTSRQPKRPQKSTAATSNSRPFKKKKEADASEDDGGKAVDSVVKRLITILPSESCEAFQKQGPAAVNSSDSALDEKDVAPSADSAGWDPEEVTAENLSFLCCTHLTAQHAAFRDAFRQAGGVPIVVKILMDSMLALILSLELGDSERPAMRRMRRDLRLIESLTFMSKDNQSLVMQNECFVAELVKLVERLTCLLQDGSWLIDEGGRSVASEVRLGSLKVLVNLTNHNPTGGTQVGEADGIPVIMAMLRACSTAKGLEDYDAVTLGLGDNGR